jgi:hypothetical protein
MRKYFFGYAAAASTLIAGVCLQANPAQAGIVVCPTVPNLVSFVSTATSCQFSTTYDQDQPASVVNNEGGFFGTTTWTRVLKSDESSGGSFFSPVSGQSGTFNLSTLSGVVGAEKVMLIFKSGQENLVGYLLGGVSGTWSSPFPLTNGGFRDVSHISVYTSGVATAVPTPAIIPGLIAFGVGLARKRKQGEAAETV